MAGAPCPADSLGVGRLWGGWCWRSLPQALTGLSPTGSYLPSSYSFSPYGSKPSGSEDGDKARASPSVSCKPSSESKALDILQQHASHYKSKSPTVRVGWGFPGLGA